MIAKLPKGPCSSPCSRFSSPSRPLSAGRGLRRDAPPAADATPAPGGGATATAGDVTIVTMTPDFPGMVDIESAVTPVRVRITNNSKSTVLVRYDGFTLVSADGTTYPALPLYKIDGSVNTPLPYSPILSPGFRWNRFRVAPYYHGLYPGIPAFGGPFGYGRYGWDYYDDVFAPDFARVKLPTPRPCTAMSCPRACSIRAVRSKAGSTSSMSRSRRAQ